MVLLRVLLWKVGMLDWLWGWVGFLGNLMLMLMLNGLDVVKSKVVGLWRLVYGDFWSCFIDMMK